jgi:hypothetical protein
VKAIKMVGLTALAALMATALVGASSAMAESAALCKADESPCAEGNVITHVHETSVGKAKLLTSIGTTECNVLYLGDAEEAMLEGSPLAIIGTFTYTNCALGGSSCTATEENGPSTIWVLKEGHETAKVTGEGLVHVVCSGFIDCSFTGTNLVGTAKGALLSTQTNGEVTLSEQTTNKEAGGFLCPKTAKLDITTTSLEKTQIAVPVVDLCVEFPEHLNGRYTGVNVDGTCTGTPSMTRSRRFELLYFLRRPALNAEFCVILDTFEFLYHGLNLTNGECLVDNVANNGLVEKIKAK